MTPQQTQDLLGRYGRDECSPAEKQAVENWYLELTEKEGWDFAPGTEQLIAARIKERIDQNLQAPVRRIPLIWKQVAAAAVIVAIFSSVWVLLRKDEKPLAQQPQAERYKNDVNPASQGATLTLANGQVIYLDSAGNGTIATEQSTQINQQNGSLTYQGQQSSTAIAYHTVSTNKGKDLHLTLGDGTEVWLDAMSSIRFPAAFGGGERVVEITGQAYFEVAKDKSKPFRVKSGNQTVEVLGTHFNINAHEGTIRTTLLEGSVEVKSKNEKVKIVPGQQATLTVNGQLTTNNTYDLEEVMAWKNGRFYFDGATVQQIMAQISRWYDIEVEYRDQIPYGFVAKIPRNLPVSRLLSLLEMTKQVAFVIDGRKVVVMRQ